MARNRLASLTLWQLRAFLTVAEKGSFTAAAQRLLISVPTVSEQIKALEISLGARLIERTQGRRGIELTPAGAILRRSSEEAYRSLERGIHELAELQAREGGTVSLGASTSFGAYVLPRLYESFRREHPTIAVHAEVSPRPAVLEKLRQHLYDLIVFVGPFSDPSLVVEPVAPLELVLVGPPGHRLVGHSAVPFTELKGERLILADRSTTERRMVQALADSTHLDLNVVWEQTNQEVKVQAALSGMGLTIVSVDAVAEYIASGRLSLLEVEGFPLPFEWVLVHHPRPLSRPARLFTEHLLAHRDRWASSIDHHAALSAPGGIG